MALSKLREYFKVEYRPGERLLVQKVDFFILTFCCLSYFMNYVSPHHPHPFKPPVSDLTDGSTTTARSLKLGECLRFGNERGDRLRW